MTPALDWILSAVVSGALAWGAARDIHGKYAAKLYDEAQGPHSWPRVAMSRPAWIRMSRIIARVILIAVLLFWMFALGQAFGERPL